MQKIIIKSEQETKNLGKKIAKKLKGGEIITLIGDLGSGKTVLTKGIAEGLGITGPITSPTFLLMKEYNAKGKNFSLCHFDFYRAKDEKDALGIGIEECLENPKKVCVIEWAERIEKILPKKRLEIKFKYINENKREIIFNN